MSNQIDNLKMDQKFKKTPAGEIPVDWEVAKLSNIANINMGQSPESSACNNKGEGIPFYQGNADFGRLYPTPSSWCNFPTKLAQKGDILISVRAPVGEVNIAPHECCIGRGLSAIRPKESDNRFLYYSLLASFKVLDKLAQGSTFKAVNGGDLTDLPIAIPSSINEQKKIGEILWGVDELIGKILDETEKTKELKKGLMRQLLTRGIGHKKFKKTSIGEIPSDWDVVLLDDMCDILDSQRIPLNDNERRDIKGDIPYYGANGVVDYINKFIFDEKLVLIAEDGGYFDEYQTRPIAYMISGRSWVNNHAHVLRAKPNIEIRWVYYSLAHKNILPYISGGTRAKLNQSDLRKIPMLVPPLGEQVKISNTLSGLDDDIETTTAGMDSIIKLKKALMNVLLTGKMRVSEIS